MSIIPVLALVSFFPLWVFPSIADGESLLYRLLPSAFSVIAVILSVVGFIRINLATGRNDSSFVLVIFYAKAKIISLEIVLRISLQVDSGEAMILGLTLVFLQAVKVFSACLTAEKYLAGSVPDEGLPKMSELLTLQCLFTHA